MRDTLLEALPVFLGALLGLYFLNTSFPGIVVSVTLAAFIIVGALAYSIAQWQLLKRPRISVTIWQIQMLAPMACIAAVGYLGGWFLAELPNLLSHVPALELPEPDPGETPDYKAISTPLAAAATTFFGALFLDDLRKGKGGLWPRAQIKAGFQARFGPRVTEIRSRLERQQNETEEEHRNRLIAHKDDLINYERLKRAVYEEEISDEHPTGWSFAAVRARADIVGQLLLNKAT